MKSKLGLYSARHNILYLYLKDMVDGWGEVSFEVDFELFINTFAFAPWLPSMLYKYVLV